VFGKNSAESEPIWMKSGNVSQIWGLALAEFGRDRRSSYSLSGIVFPKNAKIAHTTTRSCDFGPS